MVPGMFYPVVHTVHALLATAAVLLGTVRVERVFLLHFRTFKQ